MKAEYVAIKDCELELSDGSGLVEITSDPSTKVKINQKGVYFGAMKFRISGFNGGSIANSDGYYEGEIKPTSTNVKSESQFVMRENDESEQFTIYGTYTTPSGPATGSDTITVKIKKANQDKVKSE